MAGQFNRYIFTLCTQAGYCFLETRLRRRGSQNSPHKHRIGNLGSQLSQIEAETRCRTATTKSPTYAVVATTERQRHR